MPNDMPRLRFRHRSLLLAVVLSAVAGSGWAAAPIPVFESGPVRPLALSPDGSRLFALNTPDHRLEIFAITDDGLRHTASVGVGLEPVAVAARNDREVWVVNHLSDSISIVDVASDPPFVRQTLLVGDEPRDIVFAGRRDDDGTFRRAFVTTARRGQNLPARIDPKLTTPGTPRALVWVFDSAAPAAGPEKIVELFGDTPRGLAKTADGARVYAAVFHSGNQTTTVSEGAVCNGGANAAPCAIDGITVEGGLSQGRAPGGLPAPNRSADGAPGPETGLIVKFDAASGQWRDELGRNWNNAVRFDLPDLDVFAIDAIADEPVEVDAFAHVGTILFNLAVHPTNGRLYVSNTEAGNEVRFEGAGLDHTSVRGRLHLARITVVDDGGVHPRHLNKHIDALPQGYRTQPMPAGVAEASLATPVDLTIGADGTLWLAAFGSAKVARFDTAQLDDGSYVPNPDDHVALSGGGPAGLALDEARQRLYVLTRFDNEIKVVDTAARQEVARYPMHNPEPEHVVRGRRVLYDARFSSSNGEAACAACHVFADFDSLAWDLGDPGGRVVPNPNPTGPIGSHQPFHPLKGPMTTQTLRGMATHGPMHWRGDRTGATFEGDPRALDEDLAFKAFNPAFPGLLGRDAGEIPAADMQDFTDFILEVRLPPNPIRRLDNALTPAEARGRNTYLNRPATDGIASCNGCHTLDPARGFFGTNGTTTFENEPQEMKVAHLRNAYQKVGMFGMPDVSFVNIGPEQRRHQGPQVRGFGFLHDGSIATVRDFLHATVFFLSESDREELERFTFAFDTDYAPIVGQQATLDASAAARPRVDLLRQRAATPFVLFGQPSARECDLVARTLIDGRTRSFLYDPSRDRFVADQAEAAARTLDELQTLAATTPVTFTCAPPGSGNRVALDRDGDGAFDFDEVLGRSDPADPTSLPGPQACAGDCDTDGTVTVDELLRGVDIALGNQALAVCPAIDTSGDLAVSVDEIIQAVTTALEGCD